MRVLKLLPMVLLGCLTAGLAQRPVEPPPAQRPPEIAPEPPTQEERDKKAKRDAKDTKNQQTVTPADSTVPEEPAEYSGPAILSRGFTIARPNVPRKLRFRPYAALGATYDTGLTGAFLNPNGNLDNGVAYGLQADWGISGRHVGKKDEFGLSYKGSLYHYPSRSFYDGSNNALLMDYGHRVSKHIQFNLQESAAIYSNNFGLLNDAALTDLSVANTNLLVTPNTETFDNRSMYLSSAGDLVYHRSARLSFNGGMSGFIVRRRSSSLFGVTGFQARGDMIYRFTKRSSFGPYYAFSHYEFNKAFGGSDVNTVGFDYSLALTKRLQLNFRGGASRVETRALAQVAVDPIIAQVLGIAVGAQAIHRIVYIPDATAAVTQTFRAGSLGLAFAYGSSPGNGLFLTSKHESESLSYMYTGIQRYSFALSAGRDTLSSLGETMGTYGSYFGRAGVTRTLTRSLSANLRADYRRLSIVFGGFRRDQLRLSAGITWSPGEGPILPW